MSRLTFQEKMLWAQLVGMALVIVFYAHYLLRSGPPHYFHAFLLLLLFLFGGLRLVVQRKEAGVIKDERDQAIAAMGTRWSNIILWLGLVVILVLYWDGGVMRNSGLLVGILFHLLVLAGLARILRELVAYRMTA